jgi:hypothetical protein
MRHWSRQEPFGAWNIHLPAYILTLIPSCPARSRLALGRFDGTYQQLSRTMRRLDSDMTTTMSASQRPLWFQLTRPQALWSRTICASFVIHDGG